MWDYLGGAGIYQLERIAGADIKVGQQLGFAQVVGDSVVGVGGSTNASTQEVGMQATMYVCNTPAAYVYPEGSDVPVPGS